MPLLWHALDLAPCSCRAGAGVAVVKQPLSPPRAASQTFEEREALNVAIVRTINEASDAWGLECMRSAAPYGIAPYMMLAAALHCANGLQASVSFLPSAPPSLAPPQMARYEIKDISPPAGIVNAMALQAEAERRKRASILESEGQRQAKINMAEGEMQQVILAAQGGAEAIRRR